MIIGIAVLVILVGCLLSLYWYMRSITKGILTDCAEIQESIDSIVKEARSIVQTRKETDDIIKKGLKKKHETI